MWICPKCNREFAKNNQGHYCSAVGESIDSYIEQSADEHREILQKIREVIRANAPNATEKLSYKMPTFWQGENLIHFASHKNHLGIYPTPSATNHFADRITEAGYTFSKGCIQISWNKPIDYELVAEITKYRVSQVENKKF